MRLPIVLGTLAAPLLPLRGHAEDMPRDMPIAIRSVQAAIQQLRYYVATSTNPDS